jgi:biotin operon repressor
MGYLSDFEGQIVCGRLAQASATKIATFLGVLRATVCKLMSAYTKHGKAISEKKNSGRKLTWTEGDRCTLRRIV